jgi:UDP-N-acetylmuramoylalanine--D-glutamate ligase
MTTRDLKNMKIGILGHGRSGQALEKYLQSKCLEIHIFDQSFGKNPKQSIGSCSYHEDKLREYPALDLLLTSPGISEEHPLIKNYKLNKTPFMGEIEFAYLYKTKPILALTGSNGKTTTVSLISYALKQAGLKNALCGNIGIPFVSFLDKEEDFDLYVIELSSFQLETIDQFRPDVAILLNCEPTHEERYKNFTDYLEAKKRIIMNCKLEPFIVAAKLKEQIDYPAVILIPEDLVTLKKELSKVLDLKSLKLLGTHNYYNLYAAHKAFLPLKKMFPHLNQGKFYEALENFVGLPHRVELVKKVEDFLIINDSKSTNLASTESAIEAFADHAPIYLAMGGKLRDQLSPEKLKKIEKLLPRLEKLYFFGEAISELKKIESPKIEILENLNDFALKKFPKKGVLLFSPAFPSFDQFKDFEERGDYFKTIFSK